MRTLVFSALALCLGCGGRTAPPASPSSAPASAPAPAAPAPDYSNQGMPCPHGDCPAGLTCVTYYGIAGRKGPMFTSCEVPCPTAGASCPTGMTCRTIADGPGRVCRP